MVHSGVLNISGRRRGPKRRGARGSLPPTPPSRRACNSRPTISLHWSFRSSSLSCTMFLPTHRTRRKTSCHCSVSELVGKSLCSSQRYCLKESLSQNTIDSKLQRRLFSCHRAYCLCVSDVSSNIKFPLRN